jgi:hypothetical protein
VALNKFPSISILLIPLGIAGTIFMGWLTPFGVGIYVDSLYYVSSARNLIAGFGMGRITGLGIFKPMTHYPPFFSIVLAIGRLLGLPELTSVLDQYGRFWANHHLGGSDCLPANSVQVFQPVSAILILVSNPIYETSAGQ